MSSFFVSASLCLAALSFSGEGVSSRADLIFFGGDIVTVDEAMPLAEAVAVRRGKILAVGKKAEILKWQGEKTEFVDLNGGALLPGFIAFKPYSEQVKASGKGIVRQVAADYARSGYTTVTDLALEEPFELLKEVARSEDGPVRLQGYVRSEQIKNIPEQQKDNDGKFRVLGVKIAADDAKLKSLVLEARQHNLQVSVRTNEAQQVPQTLLAFERALRHYPKEDHRFRIENAEITDEQWIERMQAIKAVPSLANQHVYCWGAGCKGCCEHIDVAATAKKLGMRFTLSDTASASTIPPLLMLEVVAVRNMLGTGLFGRGQSITVEDAIKAMTLDAAWQTFREKELGSIEVGKQADFVALSKNPQKTDANSINQIEVVATWIGGKKVQL